MARTKGQLISPIGILTAIGANISGIATAFSFIGNLIGNINSSGVSTVSNLQSTNINATGIVTSNTFIGQLNSSGISTIANLQSTNINATGIVTSNTFVGQLNSSGVSTIANLRSTNINATGVITATSFVGSGANLTGVKSAPVLNAYTSPVTWTKPASLIAVKVTVVGGGGNGATSSGSAGQGGGGGGTAIRYLQAPAIPGPVAVTAGPGTNSFGTFASATAGANGSVAPAANATGGVGSSGDINIKGSCGGGAQDATGGSSYLGGGGGSGVFPNGAGIPGGNYGGGGGGGATPGGSGGTGAPGIVIVEEFY